ncbi:hypothetical protein UFOVP451_34 [uncultured Caudovirales phage]|uniref:Uncharacterized protein n=1 Tax=uncultured Caudovirales phage TaxID=2100421 RepID=A0A6J5MA48_9CAUD|nr:hypothetical protein UFOVP451_34 [uncultured Caudovirales phage]
MRVLTVVIFLICFIMLALYIFSTNKNAEQIDANAVVFAKYCYENNYAPEECR